MKPFHDLPSLSRKPSIRYGIIVPPCWLVSVLLMFSLSQISDAWADLPDFGASARFSAIKRNIQARKWAEAEGPLVELHKEFPQSSEVAQDLVVTWAHLGRRADAIKLLSETIVKERGSEKLRLIEKQKILSQMFLKQQTFQLMQEGMTLIHADKYRQAREKLNRALDIEPDHVEVLLRLVQAQVLERELGGAADRLVVAERFNPYEPEICLWLGRVLHLQGDFGAAVEKLKRAHRELPRSLLAAAWLVEALISSGQKTAALQVIESDLKDNPNHVPILVMSADIKAQFAPRALTTDLNTLWSARKDLQLALSRLDAFTNPVNRFEGSLGLDLRRSKESITQEVADRMTRIDAQIRDRSSNSAPRLDLEPPRP